MWSVGCILAEMLSVTDVYEKKEDEISRIMFSGTSCFPLSPCEEMISQEDEEFNVVSHDDQLVKIVQALGKVDEDDASFITEATAKNYFDSINSQNGNDADSLLK